MAINLNHIDNSILIGTSEKIRILSNGYVGIGSAVPEAKLDVRGHINFQNNMLVSNWDSNGASGSNIDHIWHSDTSGYGTGGTWNFVSDTTAKATGNSAIQIGFLKSSGGGHLLGNVGIGVTNTTQKLHVDGSILLTGQLMQSTPADFWSSGNTFIELNGMGNLTHMGGYETCLTSNGYRDTNTQWQSYAANSTTGAAQIRLNPAGYIAFATESNKSNGSTHVVTERVRIDASGHVQIGSTNEVQLTATNHEILHLHGAIANANADAVYAIKIDLDDDDTGTATSDRERGSIYADFNGSATGGNTSDETRCWNIWSNVDLTGDYDDVRGLYADVVLTHTSGTISNAWGSYNMAQNNSSGTITNMLGVYGLCQNTTGSSGTIADMIGGKFRVNLCAGTGSGTATDVVAVWGNIDNDNDVTQGGGKCALFYGNFDKTTGLNDPHGVWIHTDVPNYFHGKVGIDQTSPTKKLHVVEANASSDDIIAKFRGGTGSDCKSRIAVISGYSDTANDLEGHVFLGALRNGSGNQAHMVFETYDGSSVGERMRINSDSGHLSLSGDGSSYGTKLTIRPPNRTTAFAAATGSSWHDVVIKQSGSATNNAVGLAFEVSTSGYHHNAGTGIAAVKNGTNADYGCHLAFITRGQSVQSSEKMRIHDSGGLSVSSTAKYEGINFYVAGDLSRLGNFFIGRVPGTGNNSTGVVLIGRPGLNFGLHFSGQICFNSYTGTGSRYIDVTTAYNDTSAPYSAGAQGEMHSSGNVSRVNLKVAIGTVDGSVTESGSDEAWLVLKKNGGGTGTSNLNAFIQTNAYSHGGIREVASSKFTQTQSIADFDS